MSALPTSGRGGLVEDAAGARPFCATREPAWRCPRCRRRGSAVSCSLRRGGAQRPLGATDSGSECHPPPGPPRGKRHLSPARPSEELMSFKERCFGGRMYVAKTSVGLSQNSYVLFTVENTLC